MQKKTVAFSKVLSNSSKTRQPSFVDEMHWLSRGTGSCFVTKRPVLMLTKVQQWESPLYSTSSVSSRTHPRGWKQGSASRLQIRGSSVLSHQLWQTAWRFMYESMSLVARNVSVIRRTSSSGRDDQNTSEPDSNLAEHISNSHPWTPCCSRRPHHLDAH